MRKILIFLLVLSASILNTYSYELTTKDKININKISWNIKKL